MKDCNIALGRFQPFTKGHLQMLKDGYDKNGYPAVVFMISNKKFDSKHPFSDELIRKELDIVKKKYSFIADVLPATNANIVEMGKTLHESGYMPHLWLCGDDREAQFKRQATNPKYQDEGFLPNDFTTYTGTGRTEGVSGTAVRNALKEDNKDLFISLVPDGVEKMYAEFKEEIDKITEQMLDINNFISVYEEQHNVTEGTIRNYVTWAIGLSNNYNDKDLYNIFTLSSDSINVDKINVKKFLEENLDKKVQIHSDETEIGWDVWFELDNIRCSVISQEYRDIPNTVNTGIISPNYHDTEIFSGHFMI